MMQHVFQNETILEYTCFSVCLDQIRNFTAVSTESTFFWNIMLNASNSALQIEDELYKIMPNIVLCPSACFLFFSGCGDETVPLQPFKHKKGMCERCANILFP